MISLTLFFSTNLYILGHESYGLTPDERAALTEEVEHSAFSPHPYLQRWRLLVYRMAPTPNALLPCHPLLSGSCRPRDGRECRKLFERISITFHLTLSLRSTARNSSTPSSLALPAIVLMILLLLDVSSSSILGQLLRLLTKNLPSGQRRTIPLLCRLGLLAY